MDRYILALHAGHAEILRAVQKDPASDARLVHRLGEREGQRYLVASLTAAAVVIEEQLHTFSKSVPQLLGRGYLDLGWQPILLLRLLKFSLGRSQVDIADTDIGIAHIYRQDSSLSRPFGKLIT